MRTEDRQKEIPVYMFIGFLDSGKTTFIQSTLEDKRFNNGERTLLLVTEEGENEYAPDRWSGANVFVKKIDDKNQMTEENLERWTDECKAERVVIEYNGMWRINDFFDAMPESFVVYQIMMTADSDTFPGYNRNMRDLVTDKLRSTQMIAFNRFKKGTDKMPLHKIVRGVSRRTDIIYEYENGDTEFDDIEDPLPFDIDADIIKIEDRDFAFFYRDATDEPQKYNGKKVSLKGVVATSDKLPSGFFACGRHIMTCCVQDIAFYGLLAKWSGSMTLTTGQWVTITANIDIRYSRLYGGKGPILNITDLKSAKPADEPVATFY